MSRLARTKIHLSLNSICILSVSLHRLLPGPLGLANAFFSPTSIGVLAPEASALGRVGRPSSEARYCSFSSLGSDVSILRDANPEPPSATRTSFAVLNNMRQLQEYSIRSLTGDEEGQEYINTGECVNNAPPYGEDFMADLFPVVELELPSVAMQRKQTLE